MRRKPRAAAPTSSLLSMQSAAGNAAVALLVQRLDEQDPTLPAPGSPGVFDLMLPQGQGRPGATPGVVPSAGGSFEAMLPPGKGQAPGAPGMVPSAGALDVMLPGKGQAPGTPGMVPAPGTFDSMLAPGKGQGPGAAGGALVPGQGAALEAMLGSGPAAGGQEQGGLASQFAEWWKQLGR